MKLCSNAMLGGSKSKISAIEVIDKVAEMIADGWSPGWIATDLWGASTTPKSPTAVKWSLGGAVQACAVASYQAVDIMSAIRAMCRILFDASVLVWEQSPERTVADIALLLESVKQVIREGLVKPIAALVGIMDSEEISAPRALLVAMNRVTEIFDTLRRADTVGAVAA